MMSSITNKILRRNKNVKLLTNFDKQSREIEGRVDGARMSSINKIDELYSTMYPNCSTVYEIFLRGYDVSKNGDLFGEMSSKNSFKWMSYSEGVELAIQIASGFNQLGIDPGLEEYIGVFAKNRPEWSLVDLACQAYTYVNVPMYDTLGDDAITHVLNLTKLKLVVTDDSKKALSLLNKDSVLENIVVIDEPISEEALEKAKEKNIKILTYKELIKKGKKDIIDPMPPKPSNLSTICFTSGTTGMPKGVLLTQSNIVSTVSSVLYYLKKSGIYSDSDGQDRYLSYLPLAHMMEKVCQVVCFGIGGKIGFFRGDVKLLLEDIQCLKPTLFVTVPRLMNRMYSKINENVEKSSASKQKLFRWAFKHKSKEVNERIVRNNGPYDFAFKAVRATLGGSVKLFFTGSAPISGDVLSFMRIVFGCYVLEGYGATETSGATTIQVPGDITVANVGPPMLCSMYKLIDVPSMGLVVSRDNRGEVCVAGPHIFKGYYKEPEKTKEVLINGWYHTGDIGTIEQNGSLKIVDRVKNIFKLQQGEYIAPEKIENVYAKAKYIAQSFVYGDSMKSTLIGIIVPEETSVFEWAKQHNVEQNMTSLCQNDELKKDILMELNKQGKLDGLKSFEQVKAIYLQDELFSFEKGLLTPTMKSKRNELKKYFQKELDELYKTLD